MQIVRTQLPSQAIDLAVRVDGKESDVEVILLLPPSPRTYSGEIRKGKVRLVPLAPLPASMLQSTTKQFFVLLTKTIVS